MAKDRVKRRVSEGGHNIEEAVIARRYKSGIRNLFELYTPICDSIILMDNSNETSKFVMKKRIGESMEIFDNPLFERIKSSYNE